jgi:hypothetical protein
MPIVQFEGLPKKRFAVGMEWRGLQSTGSSARREASAMAKEDQVQYGCVLEDEESGIAAVGLSQDSGFGVISAAAWLADSCKKEGVILIEKTLDGMYWVCSVRGQMPMSDGDVLVPFEEVSARVSACKMQSPDSKICSTVEGIEDLLGSVVGQSFAEIVSSANGKAIRLRRIVGNERRLVLVVVAAAVVVAGYWLVEDYLNKSKQAKNAAFLAARAAQTQAAEDRMLEQLKAQRSSEAIRKMGEVVLDRPSVADSVLATTNVVGSLPLSRGGWSPVKVDCGTAFCTISWQRSSFSTAADFLHAAQIDNLQVTAIKDDVATTYLEFEAPPRKSTVDDLSPTGPFVVAIQSNLQRLGLTGLTAKIKGPDPLDNMIAKPPPLKSGRPVALPPLPWYVGEITVTGMNVFEISGLPHYLQHQGIALKNTVINLETGQWEMTFSYLAK